LGLNRPWLQGFEQTGEASQATAPRWRSW